jgi:hypothetical protein
MSESVPELNLAALEAALGSLSPVPGRIDRDRLLFQAGQRTMHRRQWLWPGATAALALVSLTLGGERLIRPQPGAVEHVVYVRVEVPAAHETVAALPRTPIEAEVAAAEEAGAGPGGTSYLKLEQQVLRWGLDALPELPPTPVTEPPLSIERLLGAGVQGN